MNILHQEIADMMEFLPETDMVFIYELIKRLLPDDIATADDLASHATAMEEYKRGEALRADIIDWEQAEE